MLVLACVLTLLILPSYVARRRKIESVYVCDLLVILALTAIVGGWMWAYGVGGWEGMVVGCIAAALLWLVGLMLAATNAKASVSVRCPSCGVHASAPREAFRTRCANCGNMIDTHPARKPATSDPIPADWQPNQKR